MTRAVTVLLGVMLVLGHGTLVRAQSGDDLSAALAEAAKPFAERLNDPDVKVRQKAARDLGRLGPAAISAAGPLLKATKERAVRPEATAALSKIGPAVLPELLAAMDDPDPFYRVALLKVIWDVAPPGPVSQPLANKLVAQLKKENPPDLRIAAATVVGKLGAAPGADFGPAAGPLVRELTDNLAQPEKGTQGPIAKALAANGLRGQSLPQLLEALKGKSVLLRMGAADAIGLTGPAGAEAVPVFVAWLGDEQWRLRLAAARALGEMGEAAKPAVDKLIQIAWRTDPPPPGEEDKPESGGPLMAHQAAERALIRLGPLAAPAAPLLVKALGEAKSTRRIAALETLGAIGPAAAPFAPRLVELFKDPAGPHAGTVIAALAKMGPAAAQPAIALLGEKDQRFQAGGAELLRQLGPAGAAGVEALLAHLKATPYAELRGMDIDALAAIGPGAGAAVGPLAALIADEKDADQRHKLFMTLGAIGPTAERPLTAMLANTDPGIRREAVGALGWLGAAAGPAVGPLIERLGDADASVRLAAPLAIGRIGPAAVEPLIAATRSDDGRVRAGAAESLGRIGPPAAVAAPRLLVLAGESDPQVRAAAAWAVGHLGEAALDDATVRDSLLARVTDPKEPPAVRSAAAVSLAECPKPTVELVRTLAAMLADPKLADAAIDALRTIGAAANPGK